jgi:hypothetical protein
MSRAWGLHHPAHFKEIGDNRFVVRFSSEGDWKHVMRNGPWQFDFNAILLKNYDGASRPSDMVFNTLELWVRVLDLPMDMMNVVYGKRIGGWVGKYIAADVDDDGIAWGEELRIRTEVRVDQPLLRGVWLRESEDDEKGTWFDLKYEKVPHFCFDCGCLIHPEDKCSMQGEKSEGEDRVQQWGEWLRASPRKTKRPPPTARPSMSSSSFTSRSSGSDLRRFDGGHVRDVPTRRNLAHDYSYSCSSRTGGDERWREGDDMSIQHDRVRERTQDYGKKQMDKEKSVTKTGTYVRRQRKAEASKPNESMHVPQGTSSKKRGTKQVWLPLQVQVVGEETAETPGKRQRTLSVFDRLEDPSAAPAMQGRREQ